MRSSWSEVVPRSETHVFRRKSRVLETHRCTRSRPCKDAGGESSEAATSPGKPRIAGGPLKLRVAQRGSLLESSEKA